MIETTLVLAGPPVSSHSGGHQAIRFISTPHHLIALSMTPNPLAQMPCGWIWDLGVDNEDKHDNLHLLLVLRMLVNRKPQMSPQQLNRTKQFQTDFPLDLRADLLDLLFVACAAADESCDRFERPERKYTLPINRRAFIQQELRVLAQRANSVRGLGLNAESILDEGGLWSHTRLTSGNTILTVHPTPGPDVALAPSQYKQGYAHGQLSLFPDDEPEQITMIYAVILFRVNRKNPSELEHASIRFPTRNLDGYFPGKIDLLEEHPAIVDKHLRKVPSVLRSAEGSPNQQVPTLKIHQKADAK